MTERRLESLGFVDAPSFDRVVDGDAIAGHPSRVRSVADVFSTRVGSGGRL